MRRLFSSEIGNEHSKAMKGFTHVTQIDLHFGSWRSDRFAGRLRRIEQRRQLRHSRQLPLHELRRQLNDSDLYL
jgi:hypothetical protein